MFLIIKSNYIIMKKIILAILAAAMIFTGCTKTNEGPGKLILKITDAPFRINQIDSATVTITKIELRKADETVNNPFIVLMEDTIKCDLLQLRNGAVQELLNMDIPQGSYDLVRLYVEEAGLKLKDHPDGFKVKVPSGKQTGIKVFIAPAIRISGGLTTELLLDFDLSRSFVMRGNLDHTAKINGFIFKPCIRAVNNSTAGSVAGMVSDTSGAIVGNAEVWIQKDTVLATAFTDTLMGHYAFIGVPAGSYSVFATKETFDTVSFSDVDVIPANKTIVNFVLTPK
jgi:predicted small secreted protein